MADLADRRRRGRPLEPVPARLVAQRARCSLSTVQDERGRGLGPVVSDERRAEVRRVEEDLWLRIETSHSYHVKMGLAWKTCEVDLLKKVENLPLAIQQIFKQEIDELVAAYQNKAELHQKASHLELIRKTDIDRSAPTEEFINSMEDRLNALLETR